ncbi:MAG: hypothetical protein ACREOK_10695 [Gemmatimonadaceae bacterium]
MYTYDDESNDQLDDTQLLAREQDERDDYRRRRQEEPRFHTTTFGVVRGSPALIESWERWWKTNLAARMRGILTRGIGR